ncbi:MAG: response regulator transcription factor [Pseudomonadota bacterium]
MVEKCRNIIGMPETASLLIVEDDPDIRSMVVELLRAENWRAIGVRDGEAMDRALSTKVPDIIILDINLPGEDGLSICKRISADTDIAVLMLTARHEDIDRIIGLEIGADDYLGKPFNPRELTARVRALLRRSVWRGSRSLGSVVKAGDLEIDPNAREVCRGTEILKLSGAEFDLLLVLAEATGRVLSRDFLLERLHGRTATAFDRSIDVLVSRLRKKIDIEGRPSMIEGVRNAGYVLRVQS